jgi:hypothetical protein
MKLIAASALFLFTIACSTPPAVQAIDEVTVNLDFASAGVVDIAVLRPAVPANSDEFLAPRLREAVRKALITDKNYAVPTASFVDGAIAGGNNSAEAMQSDGLLTLAIDEWNRDAFLSSSRVKAAGKVTLTGKNGELLWERRFTERTVLYPGTVHPGAMREAEDVVMKSFAADLITSLPKKKAR